MKTAEDYAEAGTALWTETLTDLAAIRLEEIWYWSSIVMEIKEAIETQVNSELVPGPNELPAIEKLADIAARLGQLLRVEKVWFRAMMAGDRRAVSGENQNG